MSTAVQQTNSAIDNETAIYLPPSQEWHYLPPARSSSDAKNQLTSSFNSQPLRAVDLLSTQKQQTLQPAKRTVAIPLTQQILIAGISATVGSMAMAGLVFCLGAILFAFSTTPLAGASFHQDDPATFNSF